MKKFLILIGVAILVFILSMIGSDMAHSQVSKSRQIYSTGSGDELPYSGVVTKKKDRKGLYEIHRYNAERREYCNNACQLTYKQIARLEQCQARNEAQGNTLKGQCAPKYLDNERLKCMTGCLMEELTDEIGVKKSDNKESIYREE